MSDPDIAEKLFDVRRRLSSSIERMNSAIDRVEERLMEIAGTTSAEVTMEGGWVLSWRKTANLWRLCVRSEISDFKPLRNTSIKIRCQAARHLGDLCEVILASSLEMVNSIDNAVVDINSACDILDRKR